MYNFQNGWPYIWIKANYQSLPNLILLHQVHL